MYNRLTSDDYEKDDDYYGNDADDSSFCQC